MRLLRVPRARPVRPPLGVLPAESMTHELPRLRQRLLRERHRVRPHVRDQPHPLSPDVLALIQRLRDPHRPPRREAQPVRRVLLQRRGRVRRSRPQRRTPTLHIRHPPARRLQRRRDLGQRCLRLVSLARLLEQPRRRVEVRRRRRQLPPAQRRELGPQRPLLDPERRLRVPVLRRHERHPLALPRHQEAQRHALHPARRRTLPQLAPQHRRQRVAVQPVQNPPRLLRLDQIQIDRPRLRQRLRDRLPRDLVKHDPLVRHLRLKHLQQMPADRLSLAVLIGRQQHMVSRLQLLAQTRHMRPVLARHDVVRLEAVVDIHREVRPRLALDRCRTLRRPPRQIANVSEARRHDITVAQKLADRVRLGPRLHDHQRLPAARRGRRRPPPPLPSRRTAPRLSFGHRASVPPVVPVPSAPASPEPRSLRWLESSPLATPHPRAAAPAPAPSAPPPASDPPVAAR